MNNSNDKIQQEILEKIKSGKINASPQVFLLWRDIFWILVVVLLILSASYFASFILFITKINRLWDLLNFGTLGFKDFLLYFPWPFVFVVLLLAWLAERFAWRHSFAYRLPKLYVALLSLILTGVLSLIILATPLHLKLFEFPGIGNLTVSGKFYRFFGEYRPDDFYFGQIIRIYPNQLFLKLQDGRTLTVALSTSTKIYGSEIKTGDLVEVLAKNDHGLEAAYIKNY